MTKIELRCPNFYNCRPKPEERKLGHKIEMKRISINQDDTETYQCPNCKIKVTLPVAQREALQKISYYQNMIDKITKRMGKHYQSHYTQGHIIVATDFTILEQLKTDMWASCGTTCIICGNSFGWFCPKNPDKTKPYCTYKKYSMDQCDFCGMPEERK